MADLITTREAAAILGVSPRRVRAMVEAGLLQARKVGLHLFYDEADVRAVERRPPGRPPPGRHSE